MTTAEQPAATAERVPVDLTWADMKYTVQVKGEDGKMHGKELLKGISGTARNSRTLAVMGPSGAGKSTFLNGICGRLALGKDMKLSGTAYLNNSVFLSRYKQLVSYVAQDDIVMGKDTPREALKFSYRLRQGASSEEADEAVTLMLEKLKLTAAADTLLGIPGMLKGVSGGEKKRTNIGAELITNPMILLLDEPTTGLDSVNALRVGNLLRDLAHDEQRTVICTIHTPSSELYDVFDDVLLLAKGWVVYHGACKDAPAYFEKLGYAVPHRMNPSEYFMKLLQLPEVELKKLVDSWLDYAASPASRNNLSVNRTPARQDVTMGHEAFDKVAKEKAVGIFGELFLLTGRAWRGTVRDPGSTFGRLIQTLFFSVLLALLYANLTEDDNGVQDRAGLLFMMTMNLVFMNVMNAVAIFPPERAVFLMEQTSGMYRAAMYYFAKVLAELPVIIIFPFIYVIITYWSWGLAPGATAFFNHLAIAQVAAYTGNAFGLFAASLFPRPEITLTVVPLMIMPMMLVGGLFANTERLEPYWVWLNYISFPRYIYKALMINEFHHIDGLNGVRFQSGQDALKYYGFDKDTVDTVWFNIVLLLVMMIVLRIFGALGLHVQGAMRRSELVFEGNYRANSKNHTNDAIQMAEREPEQQARAQPAAAEAGAGATKAATPKGDGQDEHDPSRVQGADE